MSQTIQPGAKISGGGSDGTVVVLGDQTSRAAIERVAASYTKETSHNSYLFNGSSMGSLAFSHLRLRPAMSTIGGPEKIEPVYLQFSLIG